MICLRIPLETPTDTEDWMMVSQCLDNHHDLLFLDRVSWSIDTIIMRITLNALQHRGLGPFAGKMICQMN